MSLIRPISTALILIGGLVSAGPIDAAATARVKDEGHFFSTDAIDRANQKINRIAERYKTGVFVDTIPGIPASQEEKQRSLGRAEFFRTWTEQRAEERGVRGIYILISRKPAHLQVAVDKATRRQAFTLADRDRLVQQMLPQLRSHQADAALLEGLDSIASTMQTNLRHTGTANQAERPIGQVAGGAKGGSGLSTTSWIVIAIIGAIAVWFLFGLLRSFAGRGTGGGYSEGPMGGGGGWGGGGGGGWMSSILGGLFGAAAGSWLYDSFVRGNTASASEPDRPTSPPDTSQDQVGAGDFGGDNDPGGGGDFGDDTAGGGGDFGGDDYAGGDFDGGGDFGGGDFGGGDFGGDDNV
jgi:uncharacterized protein